MESQAIMKRAINYVKSMITFKNNWYSGSGKKVPVGDADPPILFAIGFELDLCKKRKKVKLFPLSRSNTFDFKC